MPTGRKKKQSASDINAESEKNAITRAVSVQGFIDSCIRLR